MSEDGENGITIIAFIGSVFSPYYAHARRRGPGDPHNHVAVNVALYGKSARAWTMTERPKGALQRSEDALQIGPSRLHWDGGDLIIDIDEIAFPILKRVKGRVRVTPLCLPGQEYRLDAAGTQIWHPVAPLSQIEVAFSSPNLSWCGNAYLDHNRGTQPLEKSFRRWDWSRQASIGRTRILYDVTERDGSGQCLSLEVARDGSISHLPALPRAPLARGQIWRVERGTRSDAGEQAHVISTLEDTPFYARSLVATSLWGDATPSMHESLDLDRFDNRVVQAMLPFRMPRRPV